VVDPAPRHEIKPKDMFKRSSILVKKPNTGESEAATKIRQNDSHLLRISEIRAPGIKMALSKRAQTLLRHSFRAARNVAQNIPMQSNQLLKYDSQEQNDGSVFCHFFPVTQLTRTDAQLGDIAVAAKWDIVVVFVNIVGVNVMSAMGRFEGEVRDQEERMQSESYDIVGDARLRESTVAAIMSDDPESCPNQALDKAIKHHQRPI
jgi:hypothetical protein